MNDQPTQLVQFEVAGVNYRIEDFRKAEVKYGDVLALVPEPTNPYDRNAVKVMKGTIHIGFVPRHSTALIHEVIEQGETPTLRVESCWKRGCSVSVHL